MPFKYVKRNALALRKAMQAEISWKWTALTEFNALAIKSLTVFF